ncbi:MAG: putative bifunctional diguanylate cyclase/phosphodiesterase [Candidatus Dormibacteria bacterium]
MKRETQRDRARDGAPLSRSVALAALPGSIVEALAIAGDELLGATSDDEVRSIALASAMAVIGSSRGATAALLDASGRSLVTTNRRRGRGDQEVTPTTLPEDMLRRLRAGEVVESVAHRHPSGTGDRGAVQSLYPLRAGGEFVGVLRAAAKDAMASEARIALRVLATEVALALGQLHAAALEDAVHSNEETFRALFADNPHAMWVYDLETLEFLEVNDAAILQYGYTRDQFMAMRITDIRPAEDHDRLMAELRSPRPRLQRTGKWRHLCHDGSLLQVEITSHLLDFRGREAALVLAHDVTVKEELGDQLRHQATYDPLTNLPNRSLFRDRIEIARTALHGRGGSCAVLLVDLDNFQAINDAAGHVVGDAILMETAQRLERSLRHDDAAARLGGDEFGVLLAGLNDEREAVIIAQRILTALRQPVDIGGHIWLTSASLGLAFDGEESLGADELIRNADLAVASAKRKGRGTLGLFEAGMQVEILERITLEHDLRTAIDASELVLHFQPVINVASGMLKGVEALVRWNHPTRGLLPPDRFIPLAEEVGMVCQIDDWVMQEAMTEAKSWAEQGLPLVRIAVNLSGSHFAEEGVEGRIDALRDSVGRPAPSLEFEVTETVAIENLGAPAALSAMRGRGYRIAIDDFGVGYSMLSRLQDFPVDTLKIDRSFLQRITVEGDEAPIVAGIIAMAHNLGMNVVAEGVESMAQLNYLRRHGCDEAQGFALGRPVPGDEIRTTLQQQDGLAADPR